MFRDAYSQYNVATELVRVVCRASWLRCIAQARVSSCASSSGIIIIIAVLILTMITFLSPVLITC